MCGCVGMAGKITGKEEKALKTLLVLDSLRGEDSTGIASIGRDGSVIVAKQLGTPDNLFNDMRYNKALARVSRAIIGHNRYATTGGVSKNTAHPFENDSVVGVHNGTLIARHNLADSKEFTVDSENLYHHIHKHGLRDAMKYTEGAWALVWWDKDEETLNFLRNQERPLFICRSKDGETIFWASEDWMLEVALARNGLEHKEIFSLNIDKHYSITINDKGAMGVPHIADMKGVPKRAVVVHTNFTKAITPVTTTTAVTSVNNKPSVKKQQETYSQNLDLNYIKRKYVSFETLGRKNDEYNQPFIVCFDEQNPTYEVRLYVKQLTEKVVEMGGSIAGSISGYTSCTATPSKGYYKIAPTSVVLTDKPAIEAPDVFMDAYGYPLTEQAWKKKYSACLWCASPLDPREDNRHTTMGDCVCPSCVTQPDVLEFTKFI